MNANPATLPGPEPRTELAPISESCVEGVARFIAQQSGRAPETVISHLHWFLLENPARQPQHPLGFVLSSGDLIHGCILCCPQIFCFQGKQIVFMGSSSFYVDEHHRGLGGRIFLSYCRLGHQWPLFGTSANATAASLWKAAGAQPIPYSDGELFGVVRWPPVVEEVVHRQNLNRLLSKLARSPISRVAGLLRPLKIDSQGSHELSPLVSAEDVMKLAMHDSLVNLTAERNLSYIRWRYFSGRDESTKVFAFRSRKLDRDVLVTVNQRPRGYRAQINTLNVLDVYPVVSSEEYLQIVGALIARYANSIDAVVLRSQNFESREVLGKRGFHWRQFDAPNGWFLDRSKLLPTNDWYPVPADGDGLI